MYRRDAELAGHQIHPERLGHVTGVLPVGLVPRVLDDPKSIQIQHVALGRLFLDAIGPPERSAGGLQHHSVRLLELRHVCSQVVAREKLNLAALPI